MAARRGTEQGRAHDAAAAEADEIMLLRAAGVAPLPVSQRREEGG